MCYFSKDRPRWFDPLSKISLSNRLPRISKFFSMSPENPNLEPLTAPGNLAWFRSTMAQIQLATSTNMFGKAHSRKKLLFRHLNTLISNSLTAHFGASNAACLSTTMKAQIPSLKKEVKNLRKASKKRRWYSNRYSSMFCTYE